jgi:hypothetical protein
MALTTKKSSEVRGCCEAPNLEKNALPAKSLTGKPHPSLLQIARQFVNEQDSAQETVFHAALVVLGESSKIPCVRRLSASTGESLRHSLRA